MGASAVVHGGENGLASGLGNRLAGRAMGFFVFNPLTDAGICKAPTSVKCSTKAGNATASIAHELTMTF